MLIEIRPVAIYGAVFETKEKAEEFITTCDHSWIDGVIRLNNGKLPGLERFSPTVWVVGFEMVLGDTFDKYEELWQDTFFDYYTDEYENENIIKATGDLYVRIPNGWNGL